MWRLHPHHTRIVMALACMVVVGMALSHVFSLNEFNLLLSMTRATDYSLFRKMEQEAPNSAADRRNWVNMYFVKLSWLWNTVFTLLIAATLKRSSWSKHGESNSAVSWRRVLWSRTVFRWVVATFAWCE